MHAANPELPVREGNALHIDCPDNHYDTYLSIGVVEHRIEGPEPFLAEAYRVLKPGGKILISVPFFGPVRKLKNRLSMYDRKPPELPFFQYGFTSEEFTNYLQKAGFSIERVQPLYPHRLLLEEIPLLSLDSQATMGSLCKTMGRKVATKERWAYVTCSRNENHTSLKKLLLITICPSVGTGAGLGMDAV